MSDTSKIAIIGGGAGGLVAAISAAEEARRLGLDVDIHIYEATDKIGRPILASGNGRCNFSNAHIEPGLYRNGDFAKKCLNEADSLFNVNVHEEANSAVLEAEEGNVCEGSETAALGTHDADCGLHGGASRKINRRQTAPFPNAVVAWFAAHGLMYAEEGEGRFYPRANKSSSVLDVLKQALDILDVHANLDSRVASIDAPTPSGRHLTMRMVDGSFERADRIIVACGGDASSDLLPAGMISFVKTTPVLCPIELVGQDKKTCRMLENIRVKCELSLVRDGVTIACERGEAMFRKYGISGICAFNLSRFMLKGDILRVNLFPGMCANDMTLILENRRRSLENVYGHIPNAYELMCGMLLPRMADAIIGRARVHPEKPCNGSDIAEIAKILLEFDFVVEGPADVEHAQVRRGGFDVGGVDFKTLEVNDFPGVHIIGEALDIDGPCGGYNLTWAFATGLLAGRASMQKMSSSQSV